MGKKRHFETEAIRMQAARSLHREHSVPIFATSSFVFEDPEQARALFAGEVEGQIYSRYGNPNTDELVEKLCSMENCEDGVATASGMAAMYASLMAFLKSGDHVVASRSLFGSTHQIITQLLPRWNIEHTYVDIGDQDGWSRAMRDNTRIVFAETPSNPALDLVDIASLADVAHSYDALLSVDNCFATPYLQNPAELGADIVTHSATKFIDGQGRVLGGAILGSAKRIDSVRFFCRHTGPSMSPFNAWLLSKSLETLGVRMERHCENAMRLAEFLESDRRVSWVKYPFLPSHPQNELARKQMRLGGGIVSFELKGGLEAGRRFLGAIEMLSLSANLGDTRTIATHPASTTHSKLSDEDRLQVGITPGLVRISVGLEHIDDIIADVETALSKLD